jgi:hypothetical protein
MTVAPLLADAPCMIVRLQKLFDLADRDGDGKITYAEMCRSRNDLRLRNHDRSDRRVCVHERRWQARGIAVGEPQGDARGAAACRQVWY